MINFIGSARPKYESILDQRFTIGRAKLIWRSSLIGECMGVRVLPCYQVLHGPEQQRDDDQG
jgi:hypothetical protein